LRIEILSSAFVAWRRTSEAIGHVQCSTPDQLSAAVAELIDAREAMDAEMQELIRGCFARERNA
jgi:hypothetical protein